MEKPKAPPTGGDHNKGPSLLAVSLTSTVVAMILTALRLFGRAFIVHQVGWDDFTIAIAAVRAIFDRAMIFSLSEPAS